MTTRNAESRRGRFITFEGIDGAGKSTHAAWLSAAVAARGHQVVATREPGGTPLGESLRDLLLNTAMTPETESLLMFAARREHLELVIRPALARGDWVLCDRFTDATYAYQGGGHGVQRERIEELERFVHDDCRPDRTLLFDVPTTVSQARLAKASAQGRDLDKFEREERAFFDRVREAYLARAAAEPKRFYVIDAARPLPGVRADLERLLTTL